MAISLFEHLILFQLEPLACHSLYHCAMFFAACKSFSTIKSSGSLCRMMMINPKFSAFVI